MSSDIVERLRMLVKLNEPDHGGPYQGAAAFACVEAMTLAADELDRLTADLAAERALADLLVEQLAWPHHLPGGPT